MSFYGKCCGPVWRAYTIARVEAFNRKIQCQIGNFSVLIFSVLLQALSGTGHCSYRKNVLLLLSVTGGVELFTGVFVWQEEGVIMFIRYAIVWKNPIEYYVLRLYLLKLFFLFIQYLMTCVFVKNNLDTIILDPWDMPPIDSFAGLTVPDWVEEWDSDTFLRG